MVEDQIVIGILMIFVTGVFHVTALVYLANILTRQTIFGQASRARLRTIYFLSISVFIIVIIHTVEALGWALVYHAIGEFTDLEQSLYFSVVTATTLGYGDITLSERWQLLSTFEAMGGLILFGVTTAFLIDTLRPLFDETTHHQLS